MNKSHPPKPHLIAIIKPFRVAIVKPILVLQLYMCFANLFLLKKMLGPLGHRTGSVRPGQTTYKMNPKKSACFWPSNYRTYWDLRKSGPLHPTQCWAAKPTENIGIHELRCNRGRSSKHFMPPRRSTSPSPKTW